MDEATRAQLNRIYAAVDRLMNEEGQDRALVVEMSQAMLGDLIESSELRPMADYLARYCDVIGSRAEAEALAADI